MLMYIRGVFDGDIFYFILCAEMVSACRKLFQSL